MAHSHLVDKPSRTAKLFVRRYGEHAVFQAAVRGYNNASCGRFNRTMFWADVVHEAREILNSSRVVRASRRVTLMAPLAAEDAAAREGFARRVGPVSSHSRGAAAGSFRPHPLVAPVPHAIKGHSRYYAAWGDTTG